MNCGRYQILRRLGSGGSGNVFLAQDNIGKKLRVIKVINNRMHDIETEILLNAENQGIPAVYDFFYENSRKHIVMEYMEGHTLQQELESGRKFTAFEVLSAVYETAAVLKYLHNMKNPVIYSDMKPANVIIRPSGRIAVVDFGAAFVRENRTDGTEMFGKYNSCGIYGTKGFAAPEQYKGWADERSDVYALGCTMDAMADNMGSHAVSDIKRVVRKSTFDRPEERYRNMDEMMDAILIPYKIRHAFRDIKFML